jgi:UDP-2-acetamido-3-amino-2,3-dideoxy-glucuronate N-acetyltransferase
MVFTNISTPRSGFPRNRPEDYATTLVKRGASIGANATIICGHTIGEFAFVGAGAVVTKDVPARSLVFGIPARVRGFACDCGGTLHFKANSVRCAACGQSWIKLGEAIGKAAQL